MESDLADLLGVCRHELTSDAAADPSTAPGLAQRMLQMGATSIFNVANRWDSATEFAAACGRESWTAQLLWMKCDSQIEALVTARARARQLVAATPSRGLMPPSPTKRTANSRQQGEGSTDLELRVHCL